MKLEVGKKYRLKHWRGEYVKVLDYSKTAEQIWGEDQTGQKSAYGTLGKWLPYEEPPLDDTKLWYWEYEPVLNQDNWGMYSVRRTEKGIKNSPVGREKYRKFEALGYINKEE